MSAVRRIGEQFAAVPWWGKVLLALFYVVGFIMIWYLAGWVRTSLDPFSAKVAAWIVSWF